MYTLARLEETGISTYLRESGAAFFGTLTVHSLSLALVAGINILVCCRILGFARGIESGSLASLYPPLWAAVSIVALSGLGLLLAYPAKALTNPVFGIKLLALGAGLLLARRFQLLFLGRLQITASQTKAMAIVALLLWATCIFTGRFLAYTHSVLLASRFY